MSKVHAHHATIGLGRSLPCALPIGFCWWLFCCLGVAIAAPQTTTLVTWGGIALPYVESGNQFTDVAAGMGHSLGLKKDGSVVAWGANNYGQSTIPSGLNGVRRIAAGYWHSLALRSNGT